MHGDSFEDRLAAARDGDQGAWTRLYDDLAGGIKAYARLRGARDADDVVGETFLQLARNLSRFEGDEQGFRSWAFTIAHHRIIDERRRHSRRPTHVELTEADEEPALPSTAEDEALQSLEMETAIRFLHTLTEEQRDVVLMRVLAGMSVAQTAHALGRSAGGVRALQHRAMRALREKFERQA